MRLAVKSKTANVNLCKPVEGRRCARPPKEVALNKSDFDAFAADARSEGFDEVLERRWPPAIVLPTHAHPFALKAVVVEGEMWLTVGDETRHLRPGDTFALERDVPHAERYGPIGATYWVARRTT